MVNVFKNRIIIENTFETQYGVQKSGGSSMKMFEIGQELTIGFIRDKEDEDEFYLQIKSKSKNDSIKIKVDDIDEIEHVEGTLKFYIHY